MLKIFPFSYGLKVMQVFEGGATYDPSVLDISDDDLLKKFTQVRLSFMYSLPRIKSIARRSYLVWFTNVMNGLLYEAECLVVACFIFVITVHFF